MTVPLNGKGRSILVGGLGPLTTPGIARAGAELRTGVAIAIDDINRAGGLLGQRLELRFADTRGIPAVGESAAKALQAQAHPSS